MTPEGPGVLGLSRERPETEVNPHLCGDQASGKSSVLSVGPSQLLKRLSSVLEQLFPEGAQTQDSQ